MNPYFTPLNPGLLRCGELGVALGHSPLQEIGPGALDGDSNGFRVQGLGFENLNFKTP